MLGNVVTIAVTQNSDDALLFNAAYLSATATYFVFYWVKDKLK